MIEYLILIFMFLFVIRNAFSRTAKLKYNAIMFLSMTTVITVAIQLYISHIQNSLGAPSNPKAAETFYVNLSVIRFIFILVTPFISMLCCNKFIKAKNITKT